MCGTTMYLPEHAYGVLKRQIILDFGQLILVKFFLVMHNMSCHVITRHIIHLIVGPKGNR